MNKNKDKNKKLEQDISFWQFAFRAIDIYRPFKKAVFLIFSMTLFSEALNLINPYIYGKIIDGIMTGKPIEFSVKLLFVSLGIMLFSNLFNYLRERLDLEKIDFEIARYISAKTLKKILNFSIGQHENQNSGIKKSIIDRGEHSFTALAY